MLPTFQSSRRLPPEEACTNALSSTREERRHRWPAGTAAARVHRRSKTSTRPLSVRYSRTSSRPRALLRFLQVDVSTSTTEDRSNIPSHGSGWDDCLVRSKVAFRPDSRRRYAGSGAENTVSRHSPS